MALPVPFPSDGLIEQKTTRGYKRELWIPSSFDYNVQGDDFTGAAIRASAYATAKTNGTSAARTFTAGNTNGYLELVSGTDDDGYAGTAYSLSWTGSRGVLFQGIVKTPADVTDFKMEAGLTDSLTDDAGAANAKATPTFNATDCALFCVDTTDDANIGFLSYNGTSAVATQDIQAVAASTTYRFAIRISDTSIMAWLNGRFVAGTTHVITAASKLTPWFFVQARAVSESKTLQVHKWQCIQPAY